MAAIRQQDPHAAFVLLEGFYLRAQAQGSVLELAREERLQVGSVDGGARGTDLLLQLGGWDAREHLPAPGAYLAGGGGRAQV